MTIKAKDYWVLLCDDSEYNPKYDPMVCGVYASKKEALDAAGNIEECELKHSIEKCSVEIVI